METISVLERSMVSIKDHRKSSRKGKKKWLWCIPKKRSKSSSKYSDADVVNKSGITKHAPKVIKEPVHEDKSGSPGSEDHSSISASISALQDTECEISMPSATARTCSTVSDEHAQSLKSTELSKVSELQEEVSASHSEDTNQSTTSSVEVTRYSSNDGALSSGESTKATEETFDEVSDEDGDDLLTIDDTEDTCELGKLLTVVESSKDVQEQISCSDNLHSLTFDDMNLCEPTVNVKYIIVNVPSEGVDEEMVSIAMQNPTKQKYAFKIKCTQMNKRFEVKPSMGFLEAEKNQVIEFKPHKFGEYDANGFNPHEALSILLLPVEDDVLNAKAVWKCDPSVLDNDMVNKSCRLQIRILYALKHKRTYKRKLIRGKNGFEWKYEY